MPTHPPPIQFMTCERPSMKGEIHAASTPFHHVSIAKGSSPRRKIQAPSRAARAMSSAPTPNRTARDRVLTVDVFAGSIAPFCRFRPAAAFRRPGLAAHDAVR